MDKSQTEVAIPIIHYTQGIKNVLKHLNNNNVFSHSR